MLNLSSIRIEGLEKGCITDSPPNISFTLESDQVGEALETAIIQINDWIYETNDQINNHYDGPLDPFTTYTVHITAIGTSGERAVGKTFFQTGRLDSTWKGQWITDLTYDYSNKESPVPMTFRHSFPVKNKVQRAWITATALGVYELMLNGEKVGQDYFTPGLTSYDHQIQYQTYDVTEKLKDQNTIMAVVAGGWAAGSFNYKRKSKISADRQAFICELHILYQGGEMEVIQTDQTWQVTEKGNYRKAEWYDGETYDARIQLDNVDWKPAQVTQPRKNPQLLAQYGAPVRVQEIMEPIAQSVAASGEVIYDFGQNFAGVISAKLLGKAGQKVTFRHAEVLVDGELFVKSLRTAKATAIYICREGYQSYSPKLTYMGFRYVGVSGIRPEELELSGLVLHSDIQETGEFECSNPLINKLQSNIRWGGKSNFVDIPTDCPQRDERQGWTGDIAVFASTACYNFDMSRFFDKWLKDMRAEQGAGGGIPMVIPRAGDSWPAMATSCWGDSCILVPWAEYLARGNRQLLEVQYPSMKKFLKAAKKWSSFLALTPSSRYIWQFPFHFGDWCAPDETARNWIKKGKWVGTAYFANSCSIMIEIAEILGFSEDVSYYRKLRQKIIDSFRKVFTNGKGKLNKEFQTGYVLPLHFKMTEGDETKEMVNNLVRLVRQSGNKLSTGFTGTPFLLFALSDHGYVDVAYELLLQEECPSWLYQVKAGGTTIWERWDALRPDGTVNIEELTGKKKEEESDGGMVSFNHYANGAVGDWLYKRMVGIEATSGGYKTFRIQPIIGGGITYARGRLKTPYGAVRSEWKIEKDIFSITVDVPVSTICTLVLPDHSNHLLVSGTYQFTCNL